MGDVDFMTTIQTAFAVGVGWRLGTYFGQAVIELLLYQMKKGKENAPTGSPGK